MISPIKYLDKRSLIFFNEFIILCSLRSGVISTKTLCKSLLSFKKKNVIKKKITVKPFFDENSADEEEVYKTKKFDQKKEEKKLAEF